MSRDVLILGDSIQFIERGEKDVTIIPPDASFITEADWKNLLGGQSEAEYVKALGLVTGGM